MHDRINSTNRTGYYQVELNPYRGSGLNLETAPPHFEVEQYLIKFFLTIRVLC